MKALPYFDGGFFGKKLGYNGINTFINSQLIYIGPVGFYMMSCVSLLDMGVACCSLYSIGLNSSQAIAAHF